MGGGTAATFEDGGLETSNPLRPYSVHEVGAGLTREPKIDWEPAGQAPLPRTSSHKTGTGGRGHQQWAPLGLGVPASMRVHVQGPCGSDAVTGLSPTLPATDMPHPSLPPSTTQPEQRPGFWRRYGVYIGVAAVVFVVGLGGGFGIGKRGPPRAALGSRALTHSHTYRGSTCRWT